MLHGLCARSAYSDSTAAVLAALPLVGIQRLQCHMHFTSTSGPRLNFKTAACKT